LPDQTFLDALRRIASELDIVLVFDEIVSFRAGSSGTQGVYGIAPDLTCLAKVVAGALRAVCSAAGPTSCLSTTRRPEPRQFTNIIGRNLDSHPEDSFLRAAETAVGD